jgi:adenylylsulfate kinase
MKKSTNTSIHQSTVTRDRRNKANKHKSFVLWFTGLSGSGKSSLAHALEEELHKKNCNTIVLDGDNVRHGLNSDLEFSNEDRIENIRRIGEVSKLFVQAGVIVLTAFISPFKKDRRRVRDQHEKKDFIEVFCDCSIEVCEERDVKGLYKMARAGKISNFTGISSDYEKPEKPEITIFSSKEEISESVKKIIIYLKKNNYLTN